MRLRDVHVPGMHDCASSQLLAIFSLHLVVDSIQLLRLCTALDSRGEDTPNAPRTGHVGKERPNIAAVHDAEYRCCSFSRYN